MYGKTWIGSASSNSQHSNEHRREGLTILSRLEILLIPPWQRQEVKVMGEAWERLYHAAVLETD
jgi:hypothetical protein